MSDSSFDADLFLQQEIEGQMDTEYPLVPAEEYNASIFKLAARTWTNDDDKEVPILDLSWEIMDDELRASMDMERIIVPQSIFCDAEADGRLLFTKGKNVKLGQVRAAVGQNTGGPWGPKMLEGAGPARILVGHRPGTKPEDKDRTYNFIKRVAALR